MTDQWNEYLFEYPFEGKTWGFSIVARSEEDAMDRLRAMGWSKYQGVLVERIPALSSRGWFVPLIVWWHNLKSMRGGL